MTQRFLLWTEQDQNPEPFSKGALGADSDLMLHIN